MTKARAECDLNSRLSGYTSNIAATRRLERRKAKLLAGVLLTAGAAGASLPTAEAAIVYTDVNPDVTVNAANPQFNVSLAGVTRFGIFYSTTSSSVFINHFMSSITNRRMARGAAADLAKYFANGATIGAGENWQHTWMMLCVAGGTGNFNGKDGYVGLRFPTGSGTDPKYGWIRFQGAANGLSGIVKAYAYQGDGSSIRAGEGQ